MRPAVATRFRRFADRLRHHRDPRAGFTLVEVLVAILILGFVVATSLGVFLQRTRRMQQASEMILAYQALSNEAEVRRRIGFGQLDASPPTFMTDTAILAPLAGATTTVTVEPVTFDVKNVVLTVTWRGGAESASLKLVRVDTGGANLW